MCGPCHRSVKQKEEKRGYRSDIGIDGWPTDPRHPPTIESKISRIRARGIKTHAAFMALMPTLYRQAREVIKKHGALIDAMASASASQSK